MVIKSIENNPGILVVKPSSFGDVIHALPVARAIKKARPDITIDWVIWDNYSDILRMAPYIDGIHLFKRNQWARWWRISTIKQITGCIGRLREREYGAILDLQGLLRSGLLTGLCRSQTRIGFANAREGAPFFYNVRMPALAPGAHAVDRYMSALAVLGISQRAEVAYDLVIPEPERLWAKMTAPKEPFVILNPNSRWASKRWAVEKFSELARLLVREDGLKVVITGARFDRERGMALARLAGDGVVNLTGKGGITHLSAIIERSEGVITNDSGPLHLAVALGKSTVSIFGPTNPAMTGPYGAGHAVVKQDMPCAPCFKRQCPYPHHDCMEKTQTGEVLSAWRGLTAKNRTTGHG